MMDTILEWQNEITAAAAAGTATIGGLLTYFGWGWIAKRIGSPEARKDRALAKAGRLAVRGVVAWLAERGNEEQTARRFSLGQIIDKSASEQFRWPVIKEKTDGTKR